MNTPPQPHPTMQAARDDFRKFVRAWFSPARRFATVKIVLFGLFAGLFVAGKMQIVGSDISVALSDPSIGALALGGVVVLTLVGFDFLVYREEKRADRQRRDAALAIVNGHSSNITPEMRAAALKEAMR